MAGGEYRSRCRAVSGVLALDADGENGLRSLIALKPPATTWLQQTGRNDGGYQL